MTTTDDQVVDFVIVLDNPYADWWTPQAEQELYQDLTTEFIQFYGQDVVYIPRKLAREDVLYNEDILSNFDTTYTIEAYIEPSGWQGAGNMMQKFGMKMNDKFTIQIARDRFAEVFAGASPELLRPMEGDLVYLPVMDALFEIKYVRHERAKGQFYPLGALNFYELDLEAHVYNQETFATGNTTIDATQTAHEYQESGYDSPNVPNDDNRYLKDAGDEIVS